MKKVINIYKPVGLTPLQALNIFKKTNSPYKSKKISYPGRLDPMAEGVLILLVDDENKKIVQYMNLDKEYSAKILLGFSTDSYDILGLPKKENNETDKNKIKKTLRNMKGEYNQTLPPYSSYKIKGKSLFSYARANKLDSITLPQRNVKIKQIRINDVYTMTENRILKEIRRKIDLLEGDFRQEEIKKEWERVLNEKDNKHIIVDVDFNVSSGTYIRAIAQDLGKKLNSGAILFGLQRTCVGNFSVKDSIRLKIQKYNE